MQTRCDPDKLKRTFFRLGFTGFAFSEVFGFSRGVALGWKANRLKVTILKQHFQFLHTQITNDDGKIWHLSTVRADLEQGKDDP